LIKDRAGQEWCWLGGPLRLRRTRCEEREDGNNREAGCVTRPTCFMNVLAHAPMLTISNENDKNILCGIFSRV